MVRHPGIDRNRELLIEEPGFKAIRTERYLYAEHKSGAKELYDLQNDPYELQSLQADPSYASVKAELATRLHKLRELRRLDLSGVRARSDALIGPTD